MEAQQVFSTRPRAFSWNSTISMPPGLSIRVCDSYSAWAASMKVKLSTLYTLIYAHSQQELDEAALQRYLAEAVWFPTALLPGQGNIWEALNGHRARASITDSAISTALEFEFNQKGEIVAVYAPARYREVPGEYVPTPWQGRFSNYTM